MEVTKLGRSPKIVVLDGYTLNPGDLSWEPLHAIGQVKIYEHSTYEESRERAEDSDIILSNKAIIDKALIEQLLKLKCICVLATGFNNIDIEAARKRQIAVCNAVGYGSDSVAQHVFALLLELTNKVGPHNESVQQGEWARSRDFSYSLSPIQGLAGKTFGILGFGKIGQKVGEIARGFGMKVISSHRHPERDARPWVEFVGLETLFSKSDVLSLHAPLTEETHEIINKKNLKRMKKSAFLINTGRGGLVNEAELKTALEEETLAGAGLDVLSKEPPPVDHILYNTKNCIITPHNAWANRDARQQLLEITIENIKAFLEGNPQNLVW